ncbi:sigma-54-dependent transcriptional regulator [Halalkalibacterium ligniniphilum]|uniref:sigma-54-dependent transcriptional regulator n=1 Tax=Halalkalibacterium ligniniphilum TaxID=1134413 RepID=UPI00034D09C0|nr:sigma-54 dependent transcriptional regulator [Halalkalibacterium ligniniphilum]
MTEILIIDDEREVGNFLFHLLSSKGHNVTLAYSGRDFNRLLKDKRYEFAMIDVKLPDADGLTLLKQLKSQLPSCKAIVMTGYSTVKTAIEAIKNGANDYIEKPFDNIDELEALIDQLLENNHTAAQHEMHQKAQNLNFIVGKSAKMNHLLTLAYKIAKKNVNVLIEGETGTGKEVLAQYIHQTSQRATSPFIGINCGALSDSLLESELFGHEKGAFTGAIRDHKGIFERASKGTLFLDEIGEASLSIQVKLLRVLETGEYMRLGDELTRRTNTRILAASHMNLLEAVKEKRFREDLLYRLDVVKLTIPPLRERIEDIPLFLDHLCNKYQTTLSFSDEAISLMKQYDWPGNIRELVNIVKRAITLAEGETKVITPDYFPERLLLSTNDLVKKPKPNVEEKEFGNHIQSFEANLTRWKHQILSLWQNQHDVKLDDVLLMVKELETEIGKAFVQKTLQDTLGNRKEAAKRLNISQRKLRYLLNEKGQAPSK